MYASRIAKVQIALFALACLLSLEGCGTAQQDVLFTPEFVPAPDTVIKVGAVVDAAPRIKRGNEFKDLDVAMKMRDALQARLREAGLLDTLSSDGKPLVLSARVVDYEPGDAFKRWLMPGYGSTVLTVECTLHNGDAQVATVNARRTVDAGGGYTIGAWETIFGQVAEDIVAGLKKKLRAPS